MMLPPESSVARSFVFRVAFFAVGAHTPPAQPMFLVAFDEIVTDALALPPANKTACATPMAAATPRRTVQFVID